MHFTEGTNPTSETNEIGEENTRRTTNLEKVEDSIQATGHSMHQATRFRGDPLGPGHHPPTPVPLLSA